MLRKFLVMMMVLVVIGAVGACGGDSGGGSPSGAQRPTMDPAEGAESEEVAIERYCDAVAAANKEGEKVFADVDQEDEEALQAAEREILEFIQATFPRGDELPDEIEDDFETFLAGFEYRVETGSPEAKKPHQAAEKRLLEWEEEHCQ